MSHPDITRRSGWVVAAAGLLLFVAELLELLPEFDEDPFSVLAQTPIFLLQQAMYLAGLILLTLGTPALWAHRSDRTDAWGLVSIATAAAGTALFSGFFWANLFVAPVLAAQMPDFIDHNGRFDGFHASLYAYVGGWLLFGLMSLRVRAHPRGPLLSLLAGGLLDLRGGPFSGLVLDAAFIWLGYSLAHPTTRRRPIELPSNPDP
ncbi:MAG: hypothetical protein JOY78_05630 [Pseudonocardia sp.]|nr:hypothetical protein [Pseudonocardia sp.]